MKKIILLVSLFVFSQGFSQSLPINFEGDITTSDFVDFDGGTGTVIANPFTSAGNSSNTVGRIVRDGGVAFAGSKIILTDNLDFSVLTKITMKVYTTAPVGTVVKFKLEGTGGAADVDAFTTVTGAWETLEWVFIPTPTNLNELVFMFDFGNIGDGSANSTFYFDDIEQVAGPAAPVLTSLPIAFETGIVNSDFLNFAGGTASVIPNPQVGGINTSNTVAQIVRDAGGFFAGSKLFLSDDLDFSDEWVISMNVYTTAPINTRMKLQLEGPNGITSLDRFTTVTGAWETISWNFNGQANEFDTLSFLFDFGNIGDGSAASTFLFDDIVQMQGAPIPDPIATGIPVNFEGSVVNTDFTNVFGAITTVIPNPQIDANNPSATVGQFVRSGGQPWAQSKLILTDFLDFSTLNLITMRVYTEAPVGTLLKFKVEDTGAGFANEKDVFTTVSGEWATYSWDFAGDPPVYDVLTFMLGYATPNNASANATFLFDDIQQTNDGILSNNTNNSLQTVAIYAYPNPTKDVLTIASENKIIDTITIFDILGKEIKMLQPNSSSTTIDVSDFKSGVYIYKVTIEGAQNTFKMIKN